MGFNYGNFGGPGWTNGSTAPAGPPDTWQPGIDALDNAFRVHDAAYWNRNDAYQRTGDTRQYWASTLAADVGLRSALNGLRSTGGLGSPGDPRYNAAATADAAFAFKNFFFNYPAYASNRDPNETTQGISGDPFTGMPWIGHEIGRAHV